MNVYQFLSGQPVRFQYDKESALFIAQGDSRRYFFAERMRGFWLYSQGIEARGQDIYDSYFLEFVSFSPGDLVIDCGANYADLYIRLSQLQPGIRYISFEPSPQEYECVQRNAPGQEHHQAALNNKSGTIDLYVSSKGADSSLIEPGEGYTQKLQIEATTLDEFARNLPEIKLLKLEAEGAEPEILEGALDVLDKIHFIAADGGAERGLAEDSTIESITNTLLGQGFELTRLDIKSGKGRALFQNRRFK